MFIQSAKQYTSLVSKGNVNTVTESWFEPLNILTYTYELFVM